MELGVGLWCFGGVVVILRDANAGSLWNGMGLWNRRKLGDFETWVRIEPIALVEFGGFIAAVWVCSVLLYA